MSRSSKEWIQANVEVHDAVAEAYEEIHGEIFNDVEQARLGEALSAAMASVTTGATPIAALDVGCGSGNLTGHLLALGCDVTAADVSQRFLDLVERRYGEPTRLRTQRIDGEGLPQIADDGFDLAATYSVLHHVPDYLHLIGEMARVVKPGGVVFLDHEASERVYSEEPTYLEFLERTGFARSLVKRVMTRTHRRRWLVQRVRAIVQPSFRGEGDIHVWPDDRIEFDRVRDVLRQHGCEIVVDHEYLLYRRGMPREIFDAYAGRCADTRLIVGRKLGR